MRRTHVAVSVVAVVLALAAGSAYAVTETGGPVTVCVNHETHVLYRAARCAPNDKAIKLDREGPPGERGPQGERGRQGERGPQGGHGDRGPRGTLGITGPTGPTGPTGVFGLEGPTEPTGPTGPATAIAGAVSGGETPPATSALVSPGGGTLDQAQTTLTTASPGSVFAWGYVDVNVTCSVPAGADTCNFGAGLYLDGQPIPGSGRTVTIPDGATQEVTLSTFGIADDVAGGSHQITIGWTSDSTNTTAVTETGGNTETAAIALGAGG